MKDEEVRAKIKHYRQAKWSAKQIYRELQRQNYDICLATVKNWVRRYESTGDVRREGGTAFFMNARKDDISIPLLGSGRTTPVATREIVDKVRERCESPEGARGAHLSCREQEEKFREEGVRCSKSTVHRIIKQILKKKVFTFSLRNSKQS